MSLGVMTGVSVPRSSPRPHVDMKSLMQTSLMGSLNPDQICLLCTTYTGYATLLAMVLPFCGPYGCP